MLFDYSSITEPLPHPGEILREEVLPDLGMTAGALAKALGLKGRSRIEQLVRERRAITADTALRLAKVFGTSPEYWMNMQATYDLSKAAIAAREDLAALKPLLPR